MNIKAIGFFFAMVAVVFLLVAGYMAVRSFICSRGFDGMPSRYSGWHGCQVEIRDGVWIPRDNYRGQ